MNLDVHTNRTTGIRIALLNFDSAKFDAILTKAAAMGDPVICAHIKPNGCEAEWLTTAERNIIIEQTRRNFHVSKVAEGFVVTGSLPEVLDVLEQNYLLDGYSVYDESMIMGPRPEIAKSAAKQYEFNLDEYLARKGAGFLNTPQKGRGAA